MSLISVNNFVAPLRQRFHLITIVLAVVVFGTLRLSGAAIDVRNVQDPKRAGASANESARRIGPQLSFPAVPNNGAAARPQEDASTQELMQALRAQRAAQGAPRPESLKLNPSTQGYMIEDVMRPAASPVAQNKADERGRAGADGSNGSLSDIEKQLGLK